LLNDGNIVLANARHWTPIPGVVSSNSPFEFVSAVAGTSQSTGWNMTAAPSTLDRVFETYWCIPKEEPQ